MRTLLVISLLALAPVAACSRHDGDAAGHGEAAARAPEVASVTVDQLDRMLADHSCQAVDANGTATRQQMGVIPGAVLLRDFESTEGLPSDKATGLVFYCANTSCGASHEAAARAITAGYTNVKVLPEGIAGWVKAGKRTQSI